MPNYLNVPVDSGAITPHQAGLVVGAGTIDLRCKVAADVWAQVGVTDQVLIDSSDWGDPPARRWVFYIDDAGKITARWWNAASVAQSANSGAVTPVTLGFPNGTPLWLRALMAPSAGTIALYWGTDGVGWTQIGSTVSGLTTTGVNTGGTPPAVAAGITSASAGNPFTGKIYNTQVIIGGSTILNMDWTTAPPGNGPWTATTGETWTRVGAASVMAEPVVGGRNVAGWITRSGGR